MLIDAQYKIGTQYYSSGKNKRLCTVTDILTTYNHRGEKVKIRYVASHEFLGQLVTDYDVCETSIKRGRVELENRFHQAAHALQAMLKENQ
jgi:hypothetical protein